MKDIQLDYDLASGSYTHALFHENVRSQSPVWIAHEHWTTDADISAATGAVTVAANHSGGGAAFYETEAGAGYLSIDHGIVEAMAAAADAKTAASIIATLRESFPVAQLEEGAISLTFWSMSPNGPRQYVRRISVPSWETIEGNYPADLRARLNEMMLAFVPSHGGQLILWQGLPGTGKTWALRALAQEWSGWADFHYVTDPEVFFGESASYMLEVLLSEDYSQPTHSFGGDPARWRVLILEDTGEVLAADAKEKTGQALSRLLNVVDGLIGQGLRILVLVTTNEELRRLHPAVQRPGRCAARLEFVPLSPEEAHEWLVARGSGAAADDRTLAALYAAAEGYAHAPRTAVGFGA